MSTRDAERLWQVVEWDHRAKVRAAEAADLRHRPRDEYVEVVVREPFRVSGRTAQPGERVSVPGWLLLDLTQRGLVE